eukprot:743074-Pyramimonas_sp.AAC.1
MPVTGAQEEQRGQPPRDGAEYACERGQPRGERPLEEDDRYGGHMGDFCGPPNDNHGEHHPAEY